MSIRKHNLLSSTLNESIYGIINLGSIIKVKNSDCTNISVSVNLTNGFTSFIDTGFTFNDITVNPSGQIAIENSRYYTNQELILDADFNTSIFYPLYVLSGSLYNYPLLLELATIDLIENNSYSPKNELQIPAISLANTNTKYEYSLTNRTEVIGTGNLYYSTHFLTNGKYGYWGNAYAGEFTNDVIISGFDTLDFSNIIETIPRNLNGYKVTIVVSSVLDKKVLIKNFHNGILSVYFTGLTQSIEASDNNCILNITLSSVNTNGLILTNLLNDNQDITIELNSITDTHYIIIGSNNKLKLINPTAAKTVESQFNIFTTDSYGNKVYIDKYDGNISTAFRSLSANIRECGNWIYANNWNNKIGWLVNDSDSVLDLEKFLSRTIDEIHPKKYRDCCDIGSIIGWPSDLPIPIGYYDCSLPDEKDRTFAIDIRNHRDDFYNGMLAYYLNSDLSKTTFVIPYIPSSSPMSGYSSDPLIVAGNTYTPLQETVGLRYIIKYNNNFENRRSGYVLPEPEVPENIVLPTIVDIGFIFANGTTDHGGISYNVDLTPSVVNDAYTWNNWPFTGAVYTMSAPYLTAEHNVAGDHVFALGTIMWTLNRHPEEYEQRQNGYYQLKGLKACLWSHQTTDIWAAQLYLYTDFSKATIDMKTGEINNIILHHSRHHNNGDGGGGATAHWLSDSAIKNLTFNPNDSNLQVILDKYALIEGNTVCCYNKFTIIVTESTIIFKIYGRAWHQDGDNGNRSWFQCWQSSPEEASADFIIPPNM